MNNNKCDITVILDRSGSMATVADDTINGTNRFLKDQREAPGEATITLHQFDDEFETPIKCVNVKDAKDLTDKTFVPRGNTALLDAIGRGINDTGKRLEEMREKDRPGKVVFVIVTDGHENASKEYTHAKVSDMITHQRDKYQWEFVFLGANQDAIASASRIGIRAANSITYAHNAIGTQAIFSDTSHKVRMFRGGQSVGVTYDETDREKQKKAGATH